MTNFLHLFWVHLRLGVLNELQYRTNFWVQVLQSVASLGTSLLGLGIIFSKTDNLAGWTPAQLLVVVGVFTIVSGLTQMIVRPSLAKFMEDVRMGTLDFTLTKPVDAQALISIRQIEIWKIINIVIGVVVLAVALIELSASIGLSDALAFALALVCGIVIIYSFLLILSTCAFWFVRLDNILNVFESMYEAGRWPISVYPPWLRTALTFLVPVGFAITVPSEGLVGRSSAQTLLVAVALAIAMPLVARWFWRKGIRHYSGASA